MNIFKRKNSELDPYKFDPTRSSVSLAVVFIFTLALSYLFVLHKKPQTNASELLAEINFGNNQGLSKYFSPDPKTDVYLLYDNDNMVGFAIHHTKWRGNFLAGTDIARIPDIQYFKRNVWQTSNNMNNWVDNTIITDNGEQLFLKTSFRSGIISYEINGRIYNQKLSAIANNYAPGFLLDTLSSVGIKQYPEGISFTIDTNPLELQQCTITKTDFQNIPDDIVKSQPNGHSLHFVCGDITMDQYFSDDNTLIYQKTYAKEQLFDTIVLSDTKTILQLWPEAGLLIEDNSTPQQRELEL